MEQTFTFSTTAAAQATIYLVIPPNIAKARILDARATQSAACGKSSTSSDQGLLTLQSGSTALGTLTFSSSAAAGAIATYVTNPSTGDTLVVGASTAIKCIIGSSSGWKNVAVVTLTLDLDEFGRSG